MRRLFGLGWFGVAFVVSSLSAGNSLCLFSFGETIGASGTSKDGWVRESPSDDQLAASLVEIRQVAPEPPFEESAAPQALNFACSDSNQHLKAFFETRRLPLHEDLLREIKGRKCHILYQPSVEGFRADPDDYPVQELLFEYPTVRFVAQRSFGVGDTLDIVKSVLHQLEQPPTIQLRLQNLQVDDVYEKSKLLHFKRNGSQITLRNTGNDAYMPWAQDYIKSGRVGKERRVLVPRRLYEGRAQNAEIYQEALGLLIASEEGVVSSRLSWEGGDLQFALHPKDPEKLVLFYGDVAKTYWGSCLTSAEYAYVLKLEFGADLAVDLSQITPHVDYFISFLPADKIALVSEPLHFDVQLAREALDSLIERFQASETVPVELLQLRALLSSEDEFPREQVLEVVGSIWEVQTQWTSQIDTELWQRLASYVARACPSDESQCLSPAGQVRMAQDEPLLLGDWVKAALEVQSEREWIVNHLAVIESQFVEPSAKKKKRIEDRIKKLQEIGFHVIRVPRIDANTGAHAAWSGISYVNGLLIDKTFFVPEFGLREFERSIFKQLQISLPDSYTVVPVFSQHALLHNGGIHCISGILRGLPHSQAFGSPKSQAPRPK